MAKPIEVGDVYESKWVRANSTRSRITVRKIEANMITYSKDGSPGVYTMNKVALSNNYSRVDQVSVAQLDGQNANETPAKMVSGNRLCVGNIYESRVPRKGKGPRRLVIRGVSKYEVRYVEQGDDVLVEKVMPKDTLFSSFKYVGHDETRIDVAPTSDIVASNDESPDTEEITFVRTVITPEMAASWLEKRDPRNRAISMPVVERYVDEMRNGQFCVTHQTIAFDCDGRLFDGQHRLMAIVKLGLPVVMYVAWYNSANSDAVKLACDVGRTRTVGNVLEITGTTDSGKGTAIAALVMAMRLAYQSTYAASSPNYVATSYQRMRNDIEWALETFPRKEFSMPVVAAFALARGIAPENVEELATLVTTKTGIKDGSAAQLFVQAQTKGLFKGSAGMSVRRDLMLKTMRVIVAHLRGERLDRLYATESARDFILSQRETLGLPSLDPNTDGQANQE